MDDLKRPLIIEPKFSKLLFFILVVIHVGALVCVWSLAFSIWIKFVLLLIIVILFVCVLRRHCFRISKNSIKLMEQHIDDSWGLYRVGGGITQANLSSNSLVTRYLIILNYKVPGKWFSVSVLLFPDSESSDNLRRLRASLIT